MPDNTAGLTPIQSMVYDAVREIVEIKRGNVTPALATLPEVYNMFHVEILEALRQLYRLRLITHHFDVNKRPLFGMKDS